MKQQKEENKKQEQGEIIPVQVPVIQPNSFINGDCMEFMRTCPPNFFDLAIVDPPYGIKNMTAGGRGINGWRKFENKQWDNEPPSQEYFDELKRVSKNQIIWGGNYFNLPPTKCLIIWDKGQRDFSLADGEVAWTSFDKALRIINYPRALANQEDKIHPTQKPVELYKKVLNRFATPTDLILDTHVGSASSLIACVELGFNYVGFEIDKEYYTMAKSRLGRATRKYELFEAV